MFHLDAGYRPNSSRPTHADKADIALPRFLTARNVGAVGDGHPWRPLPHFWTAADRMSFAARPGLIPKDPAAWEELRSLAVT